MLHVNHTLTQGKPIDIFRQSDSVSGTTVLFLNIDMVISFYKHFFGKIGLNWFMYSTKQTMDFRHMNPVDDFVIKRQIADWEISPNFKQYHTCIRSVNTLLLQYTLTNKVGNPQLFSAAIISAAIISRSFIFGGALFSAFWPEAENKAPPKIKYFTVLYRIKNICD